MVRLYFYVEGATEAGFVNQVLKNHLAKFEVMVMGSIQVETSREKGRGFRGGGRHYLPMRNGLLRLLKQHRGEDVRFTTMLDLFRLYSDFPGMDQAEHLRHIPYERVASLEQSFASDIADQRVIPYVQLHEFEAILFSDLSTFSLIYENAESSVQRLQNSITQYASPELINDGPLTAPSKRIIAMFPQYERNKAGDGPTAAELIPLSTIRSKCRHFDEWLVTLEKLRGSETLTTE